MRCKLSILRDTGSARVPYSMRCSGGPCAIVRVVRISVSSFVICPLPSPTRCEPARAHEALCDTKICQRYAHTQKTRHRAPTSPVTRYSDIE